MLNLLFPGGKLKLVLIVGVLALAFFGYRYVTNLQQSVISLSETIVQQKTALDTTNATLDRVLEEAEENARLRKDLQDRLSTTANDLDVLRKKLADHDLTYLSNEKPGLIEKRINDATKNVFDSIEQLTLPK